MSFFDDIAHALDAEGVESRVSEDRLLVAITSGLEVAFEMMTAVAAVRGTRGANVFLGEVDEPGVLVGAVFSAEMAVAEVRRHIATDQTVNMLRHLLEGVDERLLDLEFEQDYDEPLELSATVGENSVLIVRILGEDTEPRAAVHFVTYNEEFDDMMQDMADHLDAEDLDEPEREYALMQATEVVADATREELELGEYADMEELLDVLALAVGQAEQWEQMLIAVD